MKNRRPRSSKGHRSTLGWASVGECHPNRTTALSYLWCDELVVERFLSLTPAASPDQQGHASRPGAEHHDCDVAGRRSDDGSQARYHSHATEILGLHKQHTP